MNRVVFAGLCGLSGQGWARVDEPNAPLTWHRTPAGTEALAAIASVPVDPADERAAMHFAEDSE